MGRAAAIAFAREGADVAINHLPEEQPDADEVIALIRESGRNGISIPGDLPAGVFLQRLGSARPERVGCIDILVSNARAANNRTYRFWIFPPSNSIGRMKTQYLRAVFGSSKPHCPACGPAPALLQPASEQAYDPSADLYDYAQNQGSDDEFRQILGQAIGDRKEYASTASRRARFGPRCKSAAARSLRNKSSSAVPTPLGRAGMPAELGGIYVQLADNHGSYATGQIYGAAGGSGQPLIG